MARLGDLSTPWRCPPSLVKVFAKRRAIQELRVAKGRVRRAERELREAQAVVDDLRKDEGAR